MKKKLLLLVMMLLPMMASMNVSAVEVEIDGLWYDLVSKIKEAKVIKYKNGNKYSGSIIIPEKVEYGGEFYYVKSIDNSAFRDCIRLKSVIISPGLTTIENNAFVQCSELNSISIPNSVTSIGGAAFYGCSSLTSITIPQSIKRIEVITFYSCSGLTTINIPNNVTSIGEQAFSGCSALTSITIPKSLSSVEYGAFAECDKLTNVYISDLEAWCDISFENPISYGYHMYLNNEEIKNLELPNGLSCIKKYTFAGCIGLTSIKIPYTVTNIDLGAFDGCTSITTVNIPNSVESINSIAFRKCNGLISMTIPNSVTFIGENAFTECNCLKTLSIGKSVSVIRIGAFARCPELIDVYCYADNIPSTLDYERNPYANVFEDSYIEFATLHVPAPSINAYKATEPWSKFGSIVAIDDAPSGIEIVENNADDITSVFDIAGKRSNLTEKGFKIIKTKDGSVKKVITK